MVNLLTYCPIKPPNGISGSILKILHLIQAQVKNRARGDLEVEVKHLKHRIVPCLSVVLPKKYPEQSPWVRLLNSNN